MLRIPHLLEKLGEDSLNVSGSSIDSSHIWVILVPDGERIVAAAGKQRNSRYDGCAP